MLGPVYRTNNLLNLELTEPSGLLFLDSVNYWFSIENWSKMETDETDNEMYSAHNEIIRVNSL